MATDEGLRAFLRADLQVLLNLVHLLLGSLRAHHGFRIKWVTDFDLLHALNGQLQEFIRNVLVHQGAGWTGADFALVEGEHNEAFNALFQVGIIFIHDVFKEDRWGFTTQFQGDGDDLVCGGFVDDLAHWSRAGEGNLGNAVRAGECRAGLLT